MKKTIPQIQVLKECIRAIIEKKIREVDVSDGTRTPKGSRKHIADLKTRIKQLEMWRGKQKRGSEVRANYSRLISRLKSELAAAIRSNVKTSKRST